MMTDPIADMLTRIRNASTVRKPEVVVPYSRVKFTIAKILEKEGYVAQVEKVRAKLGKFEEIKMVLKYEDGNRGAIKSLRRISTPGRRLYSGYKEMPQIRQGVTIVSTPRGILTSREAKKLKVGGEIICEIY